MEGGTLACPRPVRTPAEKALEALRLDWGIAYTVGHDGSWYWAARRGRTGDFLEAKEPDELRAAMAADYGPARDLWCSVCGERAAADAAGKAVHAADGRKLAADGHRVAAVDLEPELWAAARAVAADYRGVFRVTARFGILRADWLVKATGPGVTSVNYTAPSEWELRALLDAAVARRSRGRELGKAAS